MGTVYLGQRRLRWRNLRPYADVANDTPYNKPSEHSALWVGLVLLGILAAFLALLIAFGRFNGL